MFAKKLFRKLYFEIGHISGLIGFNWPGDYIWCNMCMHGDHKLVWLALEFFGKKLRVGCFELKHADLMDRLMEWESRVNVLYFIS